MNWSAFHFSITSSRTKLTVSRKPLKVTDERVLQKSMEQHATLRTFLHFRVLQRDFSSSHVSLVPQNVVHLLSCPRLIWTIYILPGPFTNVFFWPARHLIVVLISFYLAFGHRSLIKNVKQTAVVNILKTCIL